MGGCESVFCMKKVIPLNSSEEKTLISPHLSIESSRSGFPQESKAAHSENKNNHLLEKDRSKEECQKPYDEQPEGIHQLEPEFLSCAEEVTSNSLTENKKVNDATADYNERVVHKPVSTPAVISDDEQMRSTSGEASIACKSRSNSCKSKTTAFCLITDNLPENLRQCCVDGFQGQKIGQPKIPPHVEKTSAVPPENTHTSNGKKFPAAVVDRVFGKSNSKHDVESSPRNPKPEIDIENGATPAQHATISEKITSEYSMPTTGECCKEGSEECLQTCNSMEVEPCVDREEDIYRDEEEIKKESIKQVPEGANKWGLAPEMKIMEYCNKEWKGQTAVARLMKKGYEAVSQDYSSIRRVRGDNYCALRAFLFQALSQTTELPTWLRDPDFSELPAKLLSKYDWIKHWTPQQSFDQEQTDTQIYTVKEHLELLKEKWVMLSEMKIPANKRAACDEIFQNEDEAYNLYEAVKFLMLNKAISLYNDSLEGRDVPIFSWLLFARNSSSSPQEFMKNHLSQVGHTGGLEQVEMFLLGHATQHTIKVYRLYKHSTDEFITFYPNDQENWPVVSLITEDDRHYNVPVGVFHTQDLKT